MKTNTALILLLMIAAVPAQMFAQESSSRTQRFSDGIYSQPVSRDKASKGAGASSEAITSLKDETLASELFVNKEAPAPKDSVKLDFSDLYNDPAWYNDSFYWYPSWYWRYSPHYYSLAYYGYSYYPYHYWGGPYYGRWALYYDPWYYDPWYYDYAFYGGWSPYYGPWYGHYFTPYGTYGYWYDRPHHGYDGYVPGYYADSHTGSRSSHSVGSGLNSAGGRSSAGKRDVTRITQGAVARKTASTRTDLRPVERQATSNRLAANSGTSVQSPGRAASVSKGVTSAAPARTTSSYSASPARTTATTSARGTSSAVRSAPVSSSSAVRSTSSSAVRTASTSTVRSVPSRSTYSGSSYSGSARSSYSGSSYSSGARSTYSGSSYSGGSSSSYSSGGSYSGGGGGGRSSSGTSSHGGRR